MAFTGELDEAEEGAGELGVVHVLLARAPVGAHAQALCLRVALEGVQVEHGAGIHEAGDGQEERGVLLLLQVVQHSLEKEQYIYNFFFFLQIITIRNK